MTSTTRQRVCAWHPHTENPAYQPMTAMIAFVSDDDGQAFCASEPYAWNGSEWSSEIDGATLTGKRFWWMDESDLLAQIPTGSKRRATC